jgi:hypothetical protein
MIKLSKNSRSKIDIAKSIDITAPFVFLIELILRFYRPTISIWSVKVFGSNWSAFFSFRRNIVASSTIMSHRSKRRFQEEPVALTELMQGFSVGEIVSAFSQECKTRPLLKEALLADLTSDPQ